MLILQDDLIDKFNSEAEYSTGLEINSSTTQSVDCFPKLYPYPRAFSNFLYSIDEYSQDQNNFLIEGPMVRLFHGFRGLD